MLFERLYGAQFLKKCLSLYHFMVTVANFESVLIQSSR